MKRIALIVAFLFGVYSCKDKTKQSVSPVDVGGIAFKIDTYANDSIFKLGRSFVTAVGDTFSATVLKFYVSELTFRVKGTNEYVTPKDYYFLYDQAAAENNSSTGNVLQSSVSNVKNIPLGVYDQISFNVGIPPKRNHDTTSFEGDLSTTNNMYWDWTKEFIFFKFEGSSKQSPTKSLVFHAATDANLKRIFIDLEKPLTITNNISPTLKLRFDVDKVFSAIDTIRFKTEYSATSGVTIVKIANNYSQCFIFKSLE